MTYRYYFANGAYHFEGEGIHLRHTNFFKLSELVRRQKLGHQSLY